MGWRSKADKAKKGHRPSLKDWSCDQLYKTFPTFKETVLSKPNLGYEEFIPFPSQTKKRSYHYSTIGSSRSTNASTNTSTNVNASSGVSDGTVNSFPAGSTLGSMIPARIDAKIVPPSEFHSKFEAKLVPTVITNIPQGFDVPPPPPLPSSSSSSSSNKNGNRKNGNNSASTSTTASDSDSDDDDSESDSSSSTTSNSDTNTKKGKNQETTIHAWKALSRWDIQTLANDDTLRERMLKCGEDDDGKSIKLKLKHFIRYLENNNDDSPLYVFDSSFEDDRHAKRLLSDYRVPTYFNEDLFHLVGEKRRPPYRWFLIGPERSGTCVHIDPLATSAWNTLLIGQKRWVLFPPHVPKSIVKGTKQIGKNEDDEAIHYFTTILPRIKQAAKDSGGEGKYENFECYEFTQYENETVYIPNGWWHAVMNLTDTVGVTQNFCSQRNFDQVWLKTRTGRKKMAYKWLNKLEVQYPHLAERAKEMNRRDNFTMKYDPEEVEKRKVEEEERMRKKREMRAKKKKEKETWKSGDRNGNSTSTTTLKSDSYDRDAKRSRLERVVSPDFA